MSNAEDVVRADLDYICENLAQELPLLNGKSLLIAGGAGFLGYYLVLSILHWNEIDHGPPISLTVYDNFIRGHPDWLTQVAGRPHFSLHHCDITNLLPGDIPEFQFIICAASIASPNYYRKYPIETMDANVNGLRCFLEYCKQQQERNRPVEGLLFMSSSEVYGDPPPDNIPTSEDYTGNVSFTGPRACYDESKRYGETLCVNFTQQYDLPVKIVRPFNNYGPGLKMSDRRVLPDLARDVFAGRDIALLSDGSPTRTFCYIADAVIGYYKALTVGRPGVPYNIGADEPEISVAELAGKVCQLAANQFGYQGKVVKKTSADDAYLVHNPHRRCPIIDRARQELSFDPRISLDEGLVRSLVWYRDNQIGEEA